MKIGLQVIFFDDDKRPHAAIVARIYSEEQVNFDRPRVALSWLGYDGKWRAKDHVESAHHDGEQWVLLEKWAFEGEVP